MSQIGPVFLAVVGGVITLAALAVAVSKQAQTSSVISASGTALATIIGAAISPVASNSMSFGSSGINIGGAAG